MIFTFRSNHRNRTTLYGRGRSAPSDQPDQTDFFSKLYGAVSLISLIHNIYNYISLLGLGWALALIEQLYSRTSWQLALPTLVLHL